MRTLHHLIYYDLQFVPNVRKISGLNNAKIVKELTYLNLKRQCAIKRAVKLNMIKCSYREISMPTIQVTLHVKAASYEYVLIKYRIGFLVDEVRWKIYLLQKISDFHLCAWSW